MMPHLSFTGLVMVAAAAFLVPLLLGWAPRLRLPAVVLEIVTGIVIGPAVLGWVEVDTPIQVMALVGLAFLLFLAGLEIDFDKLRGQVLKLAGVNFLVSFGLAVLVSYGLKGVGLVEAPLFVAIMLSATALGVIIPLLKDANLITSSFGQLVVTSATVADFTTVILLALFFSREASGVGSQLLLIGSFALISVVVAWALLRAEHSRMLSRVLLRLQDTTAQIRIRGAFLLLAVFVTLAETLGLEAILGAFIAGAILAVVDRDRMMTHHDFREKLTAIGFGVFIPFFFITSGLRFNLAALFANTSSLAMVPVFLAALLMVRGAPALLYRSFLGGRYTIAAGLLQATSLTFIVVTAQIGMELGQISEATGAALIAAGLLSVLIFPATVLSLLPSRQAAVAPPPAEQVQPIWRTPQ